MITVLAGENTFENERALQALIMSFDGAVERVDGAELEARQLPDLLMGATLFALKRLVVIKRLSENKAVWNDFAAWIPRVSSDVHVVLVDEKPDKRTKTFKELQKTATIKESKLWGERDTGAAEQWATKEAKRLGFDLDKKSAHFLVARVGVDQWLLYQALEKLRELDTVTPEMIEHHIDANPAESVFVLFEAALKKDAKRIKSVLTILETNEDPYRLLALLSTQAVQLAVLAVADKPSAEVAKDIGVHPFALSKLAPAARQLGRAGAKRVIAIFAEADEASKTSAADPWLLVERSLMAMAIL
jgi:DNA polymerase III delta subunit